MRQYTDILSSVTSLTPSLTSGKVTDWDDLAPDQRPDYSQVAVHAAPSLSLPEVADPVAESLNAGVGKGEKTFYLPSTFVSAYRQVFDQDETYVGMYFCNFLTARSCMILSFICT